MPPDQKHLYFVDESSLASTNQMRDFLSRLTARDRVLLIGDTRQHQGVDAGRPFEQLQEAGMRTAKLDEIVRQKDPALKSAVEMLATGHVSAALDALQKQGRVREIPNAEERLRAIARSYVESPEKTLIVSPDNASRRELNSAVRQELKANGTVAPEDHSFRVMAYSSTGTAPMDIGSQATTHNFVQSGGRRDHNDLDNSSRVRQAYRRSSYVWSVFRRHLLEQVVHLERESSEPVELFLAVEDFPRAVRGGQLSGGGFIRRQVVEKALRLRENAKFEIETNFEVAQVSVV
jgi:hypothetical protein